MPASDKIRVLIVDDIQETRENVRRMLQFEASVEVIGVAKSGLEALKLAEETRPDVIIMDINMPDMDGITATEAIRKKVPFTQIIILSVQSDPSYMRRAMLAGARDFLTKPPMIDELTSAVRRAGAMAAEERTKSGPVFASSGVDVSPGGMVIPSIQKGKIIVVYSPKGGTGCSMLATNLAVALQSEHTRAVIVDGSLQFGDIAVLLNEQGKNNLIDLTSRVDELDPDLVQEIMVNHAPTGLNVLAGPSRPEMADTVSGEQFGKLLQYLSQLYTYVIVDTASYLTEVVQSALEYADLIVLITTQDIPAIKSCNLFLSLASASGIRDRILFVMNRYDKRITINPEKVGESLRQPIVTSIPFDEKIVTTSVNRGEPLLLNNKNTPVGKSILGLVDIIHKQLHSEGIPDKELLGKK